MQLRLVVGILEGDDDGHGKTGEWKMILTQVDDCDASMMGFFGEEIQHAFIIALFFHQIAQNQHPPCVFPKKRCKLDTSGKSKWKRTPPVLMAWNAVARPRYNNNDTVATYLERQCLRAIGLWSTTSGHRELPRAACNCPSLRTRLVPSKERTTAVEVPNPEQC